MNPDLYKAAARGEIERFNKIANGELGGVISHNKHTVLHVNIEFQTQNIRRGESVSTKFVERILEMFPSLPVQVNAKGDAPLHVAAKCGYPAVVEVLIEFAKKQPKELESRVEIVRQILGMTNEEQNTVLHEAVQYDSLDVVKILMKTDPNFSYSANGSGQTPLYMTAAKRSFDMVAVILENCPLAAHEGPIGKNALHAAVNSYAIGVIQLLLVKKKCLNRERDQHNWTALRHAAYLGYADVTSLLLRSNESIACIIDKDRKMTALHLAASQGDLLTVREIIRLCPECYDLVDDKGWNILHFAMVSMNYIYLKDLLDEYPILINLINEKDVKGNTPLHVLATVRRYLSYQFVPLKGKGNYQAVNKQNISVAHIVRYGYPELEKEIQELSEDVGSGQYSKGVISIRQDFLVNEDIDYEKVRGSHLVVGALIATVSFAAAFTIPGGYKSENGIAILRRNTAFQAFIITDAMAMVFSLSAVFIHFMMSIFSNWKFKVLFDAATYFTMISMGAMVIAFVTGTYAILAPSLGLAIITCLIGLSFFFIGFFVYIRVAIGVVI